MRYLVCVGQKYLASSPIHAIYLLPTQPLPSVNLWWVMLGLVKCKNIGDTMCNFFQDFRLCIFSPININ